MKYLIWYSNDREKDKDELLNVLLTNRSFAEVFEGENPLYPVGEIINMHHKKYRITKFEKVEDMVEVGVVATA
ncbi:MAG: hypothetical protein ACR2LL_02440 [Nitrosopumilus sp.]|uniref:hypothetical protein n=1 Tax=Nitrosopumilus sp. TaxID=2024843 RepID=UPI00293140ED|nr:hypothetical protein [Nitrosopumilus sp.]